MTTTGTFIANDIIRVHIQQCCLTTVQLVNWGADAYLGILGGVNYIDIHKGRRAY